MEQKYLIYEAILFLFSFQHGQTLHLSRYIIIENSQLEWLGERPTPT